MRRSGASFFRDAEGVEQVSPGQRLGLFDIQVIVSSPVRAAHRANGAPILRTLQGFTELYLPVTQGVALG